jgi:hypothetical protein
VNFGTLVKGIPAAPKAFVVTASDVVIEADASIDISVISTFVMKDNSGTGTNELAYTLRNSTSLITSGGEFASFTAAGTETGAVAVDTNAIVKAGSYKGFMTFSVTYN